MKISAFTTPHLLFRVEFYQLNIAMISLRYRFLLAVSSLIAASAGASDEHLSAKFDTCNIPTYPKRALDRTEAGASVVGLLVGGDGAVVDTVILNSSGSRDLDRTAALALSKCAFKRPDNIDKSVSLWASITYVWSLKDDPGNLLAKSAAATAASRGNVFARYHFSLLLSSTAKTDVDRANAIVVLRSAAELGHAAAQFDLARRYEIGHEVETNLDEALHWYRKSAESGNPLAKQRLTLGVLVDRRAPDAR